MRLLASGFTAVTAGLVVALATGSLPVRRPATPVVQDRRRQWLAQAGLAMTPRQFILGSIGIGLAAYVLFFLITGIGTVALAPAVLAALAPRAYFGRQRVRRLAAVQQAWPDGIRDLLGSIGAGMSLHRGLENLATGGPEPLRVAFERFPMLSRALGVVPALEIIREELSDPTSDRVIEVLILAHQRGGSVVTTILRNLAEATTQDLWTIEAIQTEALEQKINARAVFVLPWLVLVAMTARSGDFRDFYRSGGGLIVVIIGGLMSALGIFIVSRLSRDPDEPRVFGGLPQGLTR